MIKYRNYFIYYDASPIPLRTYDWVYEHEDYDGAPDSWDFRHGYASSQADAEREIDNQWEDGAVS